MLSIIKRHGSTFKRGLITCGYSRDIPKSASYESTWEVWEKGLSKINFRQEWFLHLGNKTMLDILILSSIHQCLQRETSGARGESFLFLLSSSLQRCLAYVFSCLSRVSRVDAVCCVFYDTAEANSTTFLDHTLDREVFITSLSNSKKTNAILLLLLFYTWLVIHTIDGRCLEFRNRWSNFHVSGLTK